MPRSRVFAAFLALTAALLACASPASPSPQDLAATIVAQTLQALASPLVPTPIGETPVPLATPTPTSVLPRPLYFLGKDSSGIQQVFRMETDGKALRQLTFEPAAVDRFDVSPKDGNLAFISGNRLLLQDATGAGQRVILDGGPVDDNNRFTNSVGNPVWSPNGQTLAFDHGGLNLLSLSTGAITRVLENKIDTSAGFPIVGELFGPYAYSPDGSHLLIRIGFYEGGTFGIFNPSDNSVLRLTRLDGGLICCTLTWVPNSTGVYIASPALGLVDSGLFYADATTGVVTTLLPSAGPDGTYNFADAATLGPDGKLYFFFNNVPAIPDAGRAPMVLVRSSTDGVTDRTQLLPDTFENANEVLWSPDASLVIVVIPTSPNVYAGGKAQVIYLDGRPPITLAPETQDLHWGP